MSPHAPTTSPFSSLPVRIATGILYGAVLLGVILFGGSLGTAILFGLLGGLAVHEFYRMTRRERRRMPELYGVAAVVTMPLLTSLWGLPAAFAVITALVILAFLWHVNSVNLRISDTTQVVFGVLYIGLTLSHLVLIHQNDAGILLVLAVLAAVWASDILAYLVGSLIGSHKLAPRISPNKSWEGFLAGSVGAVAVWVALALFADAAPGILWSALIGLAVAVSAVAGDLFESRIKREAGVKDSGSLLPGHGGVLDRIDSLLPVSVVVYYLLFFAGTLT